MLFRLRGDRTYRPKMMIFFCAEPNDSVFDFRIDRF